MRDLYYNTVTPYLLLVLKQLMIATEFQKFRLVGGTALSLLRGHRMSVDTDLFTDVEYGSMDFKAIDRYLENHFPIIDTGTVKEIGFGKSYFVGRNDLDQVKLDVFYTDTFITPVLTVDAIRLVTVEEIIAMKLDVISRGGRKKDFWDIHELTRDYPLKAMLQLHEKRYPYTHDKNLIIKQFSNFEIADTEADPQCLRGNIWELIKLDLIDFINSKNPSN